MTANVWPLEMNRLCLAGLGILSFRAARFFSHLASPASAGKVIRIFGMVITLVHLGSIILRSGLSSGGKVSGQAFLCEVTT